MTEINVEKLADPRFYLENFCKIKNKEGKGLVPFILKPAQLDIFNTIQKNNRVIIMKARQIGFCVSPHTKILLSNLEWTTVEDIKVGQGIVCVDEFPIKKGKGGMRKMRDGVVEAKQIVYEDAFKLKMDNGSELTATGLHKFLFLKNKTETEWKTVKEMSPGDSIRYITEVNSEPNFEDGWFSGMIDGEGSLSKKTRTGSLLSISQVDGPVWDRLVRYAEKNKYSYRIEIDKRIPQNSGKHGEQPVNKLIIGKMDELLRLFATIRPHRLINRKWWENKQIPNNGWSKIISIEFLGKREMIDLQTSEKTFIANGFVSHNSTAVTGFLYHKTITTPGVTTALIGYNNDLTAELLDKIKTFYRTTPDVLKPTIHYNTKYEISFPKVDSKILVLPSTENVGRGYTINFCLCTEIPFWEKAEEKMVTLEASVPITGKLILESCVIGDTLVLTDKGLRYVRDIVNWDKLPLGISKSKSVVLDTHKTKQKINIFHKNGQREGYRITTASGNSIGMSKIHPLLVMRNGDLNMVKAEEMLEGDYIATKIGQNMWGNNNDVSGFKPAEYGLNKQHIVRFIPKEITPDLAYLMGVILGDGYIYKDKCVSITNNDKYIDTFLLSSPLGLKFFKTKKRGCFEYRCTNHSFVVFLRNFGFERGLVAKTKIIPNRALQMSRENIVALLQGLFDTDGTSSNKVHGGGRNGFCSTSKQMIEVVRLLLLNLGIVSSFYKSITSPTKRVKVSSVVYKLQVSSSFSNKFYDEVGFRTERKQKNKKFIPSKQRGMVVPGIGSKLHKLLGQAKALGISGKFSRKSLYSKNGGITYGSLFKILQFIPDSTEKEMLINLYNSNYFYDKIIKKEKIKEEVYDFTVPKFHTFIANGFVSSNSPGAIGDYFHRMWVSDNDYIKKEYGWWWDYNEEEIEIIRRRMNNLRKFNNNYALEFLISGRSVFTTEAIATQRKRVLKVGDKVKLEDGTEHIVREEEGFRIYKPEVKDHFYVFGCLPDGEKVLTNKGLMSIEDVRLTEKLIDKEGNLVNIKNIQRRYYEGEVYGINPNITVIETKFTPEHPILVLKDNKLYRTSKKKGGARFYKTDVTWKKAKNINKNDILKIPIRFKESLKNEEILTHFPAQDNIRIDRRIDPKIILTESFWFFIGFWLAEGWINNTNDYGITIHLSLVKEKDLAKKMCKEIRKLFNRNVTPCYRTSSNVIDIKFSSEVIYNFIKNNFGQKATGKDIKEWIKYLPSPLKIALFNGYRTGDGGTSVVKKDGRNIISCVSISKKLLYDFQEILLSLGLLSNLSRLRKSGIREIRGTKSFTQETYQLRLSSRETSVLLKKDYNFSRGRHIGYSWIEGNFLYLKIKKIDKYDYRGYVNNFETETHSYCAPMMVVHNCDCSEGVTGGDYSVAVILDRNTGEEVAMWRGLTAPDKFAKILDKWGRKYNNALMVVESEAHGNVVLNVLKQGLYPSLYFRPSRFDTIGNPFSDKLGWKTTKITRPILIDEFEMMTRQDDIILHSKETVDEMTTFIFNDANNMVAMQSYHDDQIFATAIAIQGFKVLSNKPMTQLNYSQHLPAVGY